MLDGRRLRLVVPARWYWSAASLVSARHGWLGRSGTMRRQRVCAASWGAPANRTARRPIGCSGRSSASRLVARLGSPDQEWCRGALRSDGQRTRAWLSGPAVEGRRVRPRVMSARRRLITIGAAVVVPTVVLSLFLLRTDAQRIEREAAEAHRAGQCKSTVSAVDGLWFGHRVVAPHAARLASENADACRILLDSERLAMRGDRAGAALALDRYATHQAALWEGAEDREARLRLDEAAARLNVALTNANTSLSTQRGRTSEPPTSH
jgi:hypothetical protein